MSKLSRKLHIGEKESAAIKAGLIAVMIVVATIIVMEAFRISLKDLF